METIDIARRFAELGQKAQACRTYTLLLDQGQQPPAHRLEAALYLLENGPDYRVPYTALIDLYRQGFCRPELLQILTEAFYAPNQKLLKSRYEKNIKLLQKYPYLFRKDFLPFEALPLQFFPYEDDSFLPFDRQSGEFGDYYKPSHPVISRNFFKDLEKPILAPEVYSQYELEYLRDNLRRSEDIGRENHLYLHYQDWGRFCAYLQVLHLRPLLQENKLIFLIGDEKTLYPIDFKEKYGIDYSQYPVKPVDVREVTKLIWHTQLATHNGGDFFNEIFDAHPNLLALPSQLLDEVQEQIDTLKASLKEIEGKPVVAFSSPAAGNLYQVKNRTDKDCLVAWYMEHSLKNGLLDMSSRIVPALFFQPHFHSVGYNLRVNEAGDAVLESEQYDKIVSAPLFRDFKYIKTFTPVRRFTNSYGASVKFMDQTSREAMKTWKKGEKTTVVGDEVSVRMLNRSYMVDWQDRLFADSRLVRFEDGKLNPEATFTRLAAFLDLPYTESMTYCSLNGERDPESLPGNDIGFSPAALYRTYDDYANDAERYFLEYFLRDAYEYCGYDFLYYDGKPVDEARCKELIQGFERSNYYIRKTHEVVLGRAGVERNGEAVSEEEAEAFRAQKLEEYMQKVDANRLNNARILLKHPRLVNKKGQPLRMMTLLQPDPALLRQPLYR